MAVFPFLHLPTPPSFRDISDVNAYMRRMWESLQATRRGKIECVTELTLTASAATTKLKDIRLSAQSVVIFDPKTANAATELYGGTMYVLTANRGDGEWTVTHANNAQTDRAYQIAILG